MTKSPQAFRSIGEAARLVGVATHVLRYWETQFPALSPVKRPDGRRYYRPKDLFLAAGICEILREDGMTIRGARRVIARDRGTSLRLRGRARLAETLGLDPMPHDDSPPAPAPVSDQADAAPRPTGTPQQEAAAARDRPAARSSRPRRRAPVVETLPLFPDLMEPSAPAANPVPTARPAAAAPRMPQAPWLSRLCRTAAALRGRTTPLPDGARHIADQLRDARAKIVG